MTMKLSALAGLALAGALLLAGCGGDDDTATGRSTNDGATTQAFNDTDVTFAQEMIPHHEQAIQMAKLASSRAASDEVKQLAAAIEAAQDPEIQAMTGWLQSWGEEVPEDMNSTGHGDMDMPGMMSDADMEELEQATDVGFDRMFLQMMIKHHQGAIEMARTEQANGRNPDAVALAKQIETAQTAEIATMQQLLGS
jgi:uncharacterized protein (DUF305 family)